MKQDLNGVRTPEDVVRRYDFEDIPVLVKSTKEIALEVGKKVGDDEIISKINLSPEEVKIKGNKISLEGQTLDLTSNNIQINSDNFKVDNYGNMTCNNAKINGDLIKEYEGDYGKTHTIIGNPTGIGEAIEIYNEDENGDPDFKTFINPGNIVCEQGANYNAILGYGGVLWLFDAPNPNPTIKLEGYTGNITCVSLTQTSVEEKKKDFEKLDNALEIVKDTDIYKYHFKNEEETDKKHIGFVIGENYNYRKELTDEENNNVDLYSMISVLWRAVQEQQKEIEELKKKVEK